MKKTVGDKLERWIEREFTSWMDGPSIDIGYRAGHKSAAIDLGKKLREKEKQLNKLRQTVFDLVKACEGYARDAAETEAVLNCFEQVEWEKTDWKFVDIGDTVKFVYGDASNIWRQK
jgi:hypothetical protein